MSAEYNITFDWNRISTLGKVKVLVEQVVGSPSQEAITQAVEDYIESHPGSLSPLSPAVKAALLQIAEKVAYVDENGQDYYDALDAALSAKALLQITAVYTQSGTVYDTDTLDSLKSDLVVTAYYDDGTTGDVTSAAVLSGTLEEGTSTITATYQEKTATFDVTVTHSPVPREYTSYDYLYRTTANTSGLSNARGIFTHQISDLVSKIIDFDCMYLEEKTSDICVLGAQVTGGGRCQFYGRTDTSSMFAWSHGTKIQSDTIPGIVVNNTFHVTLNPNTSSPSTFTIDGISKTGAWSGSPSINLPLAYCGTYGSDNKLYVNRMSAIGTLKISDSSGELIHEYHPCVRNADQQIGIYDTVTQEFLTTSTASYATIGHTNNVYVVGNWE